MGTWSIKPFGNDSALDWLDELEKSKDGSSLITNSIQLILNKRYDGCSKLSERALAAISVVSAATLDPIKGTNQAAKAWVQYKGFVPKIDLIEQSIRALQVITTNSELYDLWSETASLKTWLKDADKIKNILINSKRVELPERKPKKKSLPRMLYKLVEFYNFTPDKKIREKIFTKIKSIQDVNHGSNETDFELPLSLTSRYGLLEETEYLLEQGADPNVGTPIIWACLNGHINIANKLLKVGATLLDEMVIDENKGCRYNPEFYKNSNEIPKLITYKYCSALSYASSSSTPDIIDYLIEYGADIHQLDLNGETLVHKACDNKNRETLEHLIKLGVDVNVSKGIINGNPNSRGDSALHYAVSRDFTEGVKLLLENGAKPNLTQYFLGNTNAWEKTPLDLIKTKQDSKIYKLLINAGGMLSEQLKEHNKAIK